MDLTAGQTTGLWETYQTEFTGELDQARRALKEINLMLEQSQVELTKLSQRNNAINVHLQQVQAQLDSLPRADIRMAYDAALDAQQRLFVMRGQLEKLQSDQGHLTRLVDAYEKIQQLMEGGKPEEQPVKVTAATASVEMLINAQEAERKRLSRQMHDGPAQAMSNFILQTEIAMRMFDLDPVKAKEELNNLKLAAMSTFQKVRSFIFELRPMMLDDLGLTPTVTKYVETIKEQSGQDINLVVTGGQDKRLEPYLEVLIFRGLQELLSNAIRHGQATQVKIILNIDENQVRFSVEDNGKGFDPKQATDTSGLGLQLIQERVEMLAGTFEIDSNPGQGTRIAMWIPISRAKNIL